MIIHDRLESHFNIYRQSQPQRCKVGKDVFNLRAFWSRGLNDNAIECI